MISPPTFHLSIASSPDSFRRLQIGGKAACLFELQAAGFRVPEFELAPAAPEELAQVAARIGFPLAVRSSATVEDGSDSSFAGQFQSFLNLRSQSELELAVAQCRDSVHSAGVVAYCRQHGIDPDAIRMEVIIQRMIEPELAGVAFTVNPTTGSEEVVVEACAGLADGLLAGSQTALPAEHPLLAAHLSEITATMRRVQRHFGAPQDVEFAIADGVLYLLQARPITRIGFSPELGEWTNANFRDGGVSSSVCTPLMWSLYDLIWDQTLKGCLREIRLSGDDFQAGRMFFGRPYWNLGAVKQRMTRVPGFTEREFDADLDVRIDYEGPGRRTPVTPWTVWRAIPTIAALPGFFRRQQQQAETLLTDFPTIERRWNASSAEAASTFRELIERDYLRTESTYFRTIYAVSLAKLDFVESFPACDYAALVAALPELQHMAPLRAKRAQSERGESDVDALVTAFRHQCRFGIDVCHPRWDEDAEFAGRLLSSLTAAAGVDPRPAYERARAESRARLPWWRRAGFDRKLDRLRRFIWLREELRDVSGRMYYLIRSAVRIIARRRGLSDEIFFQTFREIYDDDRSAVESRREVYDSYRNFQPPNEIGGRFQYERRAAPRGALTGIGASNGIARGVARIAHDVQAALRAEAGSILICPFTEPGWTLVLDRVAGVVTETGGQLSHAAVLCREYGIPAVLGVAAATRRIRDGALVELNGHEGTVVVREP